ncbi:Clavaminate synthase-like protein [Coniophora puteana RWD-64-598 SS2]|uniref:Clavaminate synthase-like protein n=1 Tax=Coniophora puteana (strain RWD-64-598) TaxID=741705 RepID=A0A5M3MK31_CONPW|nr:Clavaminate synthase-like protein [Coniophora puteana RWD-64-598 SS2]EIW79588.1 Clavaminate synthase-like protein [Coniophora puteana RWD-64-598 SS2]
MPSTTVPYVPHYEPAPLTQENLKWADLAVIDLAKAGTPEGRAELALEVNKALRNHGFFYVINHGYTQAQNERMFDIADRAFAGVSAEEKQLYASNIKQTGSYQGYKLRNYWHIDNGVHDQLEHYNINRDTTKKPHPEAVRPFLPEVESFARFNHHLVLHPILRLIALSLELPEEELVNTHGYHEVGETYVRFMKYYPRSDEEEAKTNNVWLKGHTDFGSLTILWSQPVSALQIQTTNGEWQWIKHIDNALVVNAGDALEFLTGGYYKGTIHRVRQPPADQQSYTRLGVFYFAMPDDAVRLTPLTASPVLQRAGIQRRFEDNAAPTMEQWRRGRTSAYGASELKRSKEDGVEEEVINGVLVKHYN